MSVGSFDAHGSTRNLTVSVVAASGEELPDSLIENLAREVIDVIAIPASRIGGNPPESRVILAWLPGGADDEILDMLTRWVDDAPERVGIIGCIAEDQPGDAEHTLAAGFDDVIVGPISVRELAARVRALSRRIDMSSSQPRRVNTFGDISIDPSRFQLSYKGRRVLLTRTELAVISALAGAQGNTITRTEILDAAWGEQNFEIGERAVDNVILRLRRKIGDPNVIVTVRGVGFRLTE